MTKNLYFLSYQNESIADIIQLAYELHFRGIVPWVDKLPGGFHAGDPSELEARRVIREDSSGFLLYLTEKALDSDFINNIEVPEALERQRQEPSYPIVVVSPHFRFSELKRLTREKFGIDLTFANGYARNEDELIERFLAKVAVHILRKHVSALPPPSSTVELSVSSYESIASTPNEVLRVDATQALGGDVTNTAIWSHLLAGVQDAKCEIANRFGRPRLVINGSKHFTAAFIVGRVFNQFQLDIRQKDDHWSTVGAVQELNQFDVEYLPGSYTSRTLVAEVATGHKNLSTGVDQLVESRELAIGGRIRVRPRDGRVEVDDSISRSLAHQVYREIDRAANTSNKPVESVHLFVAAPQAFFMTLGTLFQGMPEVHLYEWTGCGYAKSLVIPSRLR